MIWNKKGFLCGPNAGGPDGDANGPSMMLPYIPNGKPNPIIPPNGKPPPIPMPPPMPPPKPPMLGP